MKPAFIIPVRDEAGVLAWSLRTLHDWADRTYGHRGYVIIVSENGSKDGTPELAAALAERRPRLRVVRSAASGKGGAVKRGAAAVSADIYVMMDVDLSTDLACVEALVSEAANGADLAVASRRLPGAEVRRPLSRRAVTAAYGLVVSAGLGLGVRDAQCGCKAFSRRVRDGLLPRVADDGFFFDTELLVRAAREGYRIVERPVRWSDRSELRRSSKVRLLSTSAEFLKKVRELRRAL